jgi:hypothetical protein
MTFGSLVAAELVCRALNIDQDDLAVSAPSAYATTSRPPANAAAPAWTHDDDSRFFEETFGRVVRVCRPGCAGGQRRRSRRDRLHSQRDGSERTGAQNNRKHASTIDGCHDILLIFSHFEVV